MMAAFAFVNGHFGSCQRRIIVVNLDEGYCIQDGTAGIEIRKCDVSHCEATSRGPLPNLQGVHSVPGGIHV